MPQATTISAVALLVTLLERRALDSGLAYLDQLVGGYLRGDSSAAPPKTAQDAPPHVEAPPIAELCHCVACDPCDTHWLEQWAGTDTGSTVVLVTAFFVVFFSVIALGRSRADTMLVPAAAVGYVIGT